MERFLSQIFIGISKEESWVKVLLALMIFFGPGEKIAILFQSRSSNSSFIFSDIIIPPKHRKILDKLNSTSTWGDSFHGSDHVNGLANEFLGMGLNDIKPNVEFPHSTDANHQWGSNGVNQGTPWDLDAPVSNRSNGISDFTPKNMHCKFAYILCFKIFND